MARTSLEERFGDLDQWAAPTFQPVRVAEVARRAASRRLRRRGLIAAAAAVLMALPAVAVILNGREGREPIVGPTTTPQVTVSAPPTPGVPTRKVQFPAPLLPGQRLAIQWVDKDHAWLQADCAAALNQVDCRPKLAGTSDRGRTWREVTLPGEVLQKRIGIQTVDRALLFAVDPGIGLWMSKDAGVSFTYHTFADPPAEWSTTAEGPYHMQCNNRMNWDPAKDTGQCRFKRLVRSGIGPTRYQPPWTSLDTRVVGTGPDGRIWLSHPSGLAFSADEGKTWKETNLENANGITFSPSGRYALAETNGGRWHYNGQGWNKVELPAGMRHSNVAAPLDNGQLLVGNPIAGVGFLSGQAFTPIPGVIYAEPAAVLRDGTILLHYTGWRDERGIYLGTGEGGMTEWTLVIY